MAGMEEESEREMRRWAWRTIACGAWYAFLTAVALVAISWTVAHILLKAWPR